MAELRPYFPFFFCLLLFSCTSVLARRIEQSVQTSVFDVSASVQRTIDILSFSPEMLEVHEQGSKVTNSSFSVKLYSRDTLHRVPSRNYRDLTLSRLKRDSFRVNFLYKMLSPEAVTPPEFKAMGVAAPVTSGISQGSGEYFARFGFGTPAKPLYTAIDTGSDITWIQCTPCSDCYKQSDPIFDPSTSSSYKLLSCGSPQCQQLQVSRCDSDRCLYAVEYGDGSVTIGDFATETLTIGNSAINNIAIGCGRDNEGLFTGAAGLLGLGRGSLSFPAQIKAPAFSYCLVDKDSTSASTIEFGSSAAANNAVKASLLKSSKRGTFYYVGLTGISVGGRMLPISPSVFAIDSSGDGGVILDSGTAVTRFIPEVYNAMRDEFKKGTTNLQYAGGFSLFDTCYDLTGRTSARVPAVMFHFGSESLRLPAKNYLLPVGESIYCFAFASMSGSISIIGNVQQQGIRVSFDSGRSQIGFSPNSC